MQALDAATVSYACKSVAASAWYCSCSCALASGTPSAQPGGWGVDVGSPMRVAGTIVRFYTLRAPSLVGDRYFEPTSEDRFVPICRKYAGLAV
jgi:hypothetical protein